MPRATLIKELELIESIVAAHPDGIGITGIEAEMMRCRGNTPHRRTLQRRLHKLISEQRLTTEGDSIALVYKQISGNMVSTIGVMTPAATVSAETALYVPVSPEGAVIRQHIRHPLMQRRPVGYQRDFLEAYQPGETFYLPAPLRSQLHEMGRTSVLAPV